MKFAAMRRNSRIHAREMHKMRKKFTKKHKCRKPSFTFPPPESGGVGPRQTCRQMCLRTVLKRCPSFSMRFCQMPQRITARHSLAALHRASNTSPALQAPPQRHRRTASRVIVRGARGAGRGSRPSAQTVGVKRNCSIPSENRRKQLLELDHQHFSGIRVLVRLRPRNGRGGIICKQTRQ